MEAVDTGSIALSTWGERHQITVSEANEALADVDAVWFDPDPSADLGAAFAFLVIGTADAQFSRSSLCVARMVRATGERTGGQLTAPIGAGTKGASDER
ncbi:hypothetical protein GCM10027414_06190 [Humibacter ginsengiterrae]